MYSLKLYVIVSSFKSTSFQHTGHVKIAYLGVIMKILKHKKLMMLR